MSALGHVPNEHGDCPSWCRACGEEQRERIRQKAEEAVRAVPTVEQVEALKAAVGRAETREVQALAQVDELTAEVRRLKEEVARPALEALEHARAGTGPVSRVHFDTTVARSRRDGMRDALAVLVLREGQAEPQAQLCSVRDVIAGCRRAVERLIAGPR